VDGTVARQKRVPTFLFKTRKRRDNPSVSILTICLPTYDSIIYCFRVISVFFVPVKQ
jgi:hypothetical protein